MEDKEGLFWYSMGIGVRDWMEWNGMGDIPGWLAWEKLMALVVLFAASASGFLEAEVSVLCTYIFLSRR